MNETYLRRFLTLAARREIPVFWVLPPYSPGLQTRNERSGEDGGHAEFVRATLRRFPGVVVIDARALGYADRVFHDACHLDRDGAAALSAAVAQVVRARLDGPTAGAGEHWVALPSVRAGRRTGAARLARRPSGSAPPRPR